MGRSKGWAYTGLLFSAAGIAASVTQIVERIALAEDPKADLLCNVGRFVSCTDVLLAPQASVFGPIPNSAIGVMMFSLFLGAFAAAAAGSSISRAFARIVQGLLLFMLAFVTWFMYQTAFVIGSLCLYCTVIATAAVVANVAWWRSTHRRSNGLDAFLGVSWWLLVAAAVFYGLWA